MEKKHALEIWSATILSLATVATAWSAYQSARWSGVQAISFSRANSERLEANRYYGLAEQQEAVDVEVFVAWGKALVEKEEVLANFLYERFRPEFRKAVDAWLATRPLQTPDAPPTPFAMPEYSLKARADGDEAHARAAQLFEEGRTANQRSDNYVLLTVLFASVLFFAGIATQFRAFTYAIVMLSIGTLIFLVALGVLVTFPVY
ncbi:MAG: hypothetical protein ACOX6T_19685 [Myxococcales bacterium]|jgi:hypothetical protein